MERREGSRDQDESKGRIRNDDLHVCCVRCEEIAMRTGDENHVNQDRVKGPQRKRVNE